MRTLIIGYGNRGRNDDGVGWFVVERLEDVGLPGVELVASHQLEVDHAETISQFDVIIFVDAASVDSRQLLTRAVVFPKLQEHAVSHHLTPADVLALCQSLYRRQPQAILFSIRGHDFNFGSTLSAATERAALEAVREIRHVVEHYATNTGGRAACA